MELYFYINNNYSVFIIPLGCIYVFFSLKSLNMFHFNDKRDVIQEQDSVF